MISFVGAGPGAADLITLRGAARLACADVVIWASSLVPEALLAHCQPEVVVFDSKAMTLEDVTGVFGDYPAAAIVRLHSGDPTIFSTIGEQLDWCVANERAFEIVPGVTSLAAAAATVGRELTLPGISQSVVLTRVAARTSASMPAGEGVAQFSAFGSTMAVFLSAARPDVLQEGLLAAGSAYSPDTPAVVAHRVSWPDERVVTTTVGALADAIKAMGVSTTVLVLVGDALGRGDAGVSGPPGRRSHVYDGSYTHRFRSGASSTADRD